MMRFTGFLAALLALVGATAAQAAVWRVPGDKATVKEAVAIAGPGDTIEVGAGRWCGAFIDKSLNLVGRDGAVIAGSSADGTSCTEPMVSGFRAGFVLSSSDASGTTIRHFTFDGVGVGPSDPNALAFAVYARDLLATVRKVNRVVIEHNKVRGTMQTFTNFGGNGWIVRYNEIRDLTVRRMPDGMVVGGFGVLVRDHSGSRPTGNVIAHNRIEGNVPSGLPAGRRFSGVFVASAEGTEVAFNDLRLAPGPDQEAAATGIGIVVTSVSSVPGSGSRATVVSRNNGKQSDYVVDVTLPKGDNAADLQGNLGRVLYEGAEVDSTGRKDVAGMAATGRKVTRDDGSKDHARSR